MTPEESKAYIHWLAKSQREDILKGHGASWETELPIAEAIQRADNEERMFSSETIIGASPVDESISFSIDTANTVDQPDQELANVGIVTTASTDWDPIGREQAEPQIIHQQGVLSEPGNRERPKTLRDNPLNVPVAKAAAPGTVFQSPLSKTQQAASGLHEALSPNGTKPATAKDAPQPQPPPQAKGSKPDPTSLKLTNPFPFLQNGINLNFNTNTNPPEFSGESAGMGDVAGAADDLAEATEGATEAILLVIERIVTTLQGFKNQLDSIAEIIDRSNGG